MIFEESGTLTVSTASAGSSLPIQGSVVRIRGASSENSGIEYSVITDVDGITERISLPAHRKTYSEAPRPPFLPYGLYNVEVVSQNYFTKNVFNVAVFSGVNTELPINMIPSPIYENDAEYPRENLMTIIPKNEI